MKIGLFYNSLIHPSGGARMLLIYAKLLSELGYRPIILTGSVSSRIFNVFKELKNYDIIVLGRYFQEINLLKEIRKWNIEYLFLFSKYYLAKLIKYLNTDVRVFLYIFFPYSYVYSFSLDEIKKRVGLKRRILRGLEHYLYNNADRILTISRFSQKIINNIGLKSVVLYEPIDTDFFKPDWKKKRYNLIISVSQFTPGKMFHKMILLFKKLQGEYELVLAGGINPAFLKYIIYLKKIARDDKRIKFIFNPDDNQLRELYQRATVYWHLREEHHILTPLEAMACGTPSVLTAKGGIDGAIHEFNSFLARNEDEFIRYSEILLQNRNLWYKMASNAVISVKRFSLSNIKKDLNKVLLSLSK